jgi:putative SOS response-associated peptidase YedK
MCGRFTLRTPAGVLIQQFRLQSVPDLSPRYNIAPTQPAPVVRMNAGSGERELVLLRWGLVPSWAKDPSIGNRLINARSETIASKPSFRSAFRRRRCLVIADGYYEWKKLGSRKQPYYIRRQDEQPMGLAGLWEHWSSPTEEEADHIQSCTIITTQANDLTRDVHDRMPVILSSDDHDMWLDPELEDRDRLQTLLEPAASDTMIMDPVSTYVNSPRNEGPECVAIQRQLF